MDSSPSAAALPPTFHSSAVSFLQALQTPESYLDMLLVCGALAVAFLLGVLTRRGLRRRSIITRLQFSKDTKRRFARMLTPLYAALLLTLTQSVDVYLHGPGLIVNHALHLAVAWLLVRFVILIVRTKPVAVFLSAFIVFGATLHALGIGHSVHMYLAETDIEIGKLKISMLGVVHGVVVCVFMFWLARTLSKTLEDYLRRVSSMSYNVRELSVKLFTVSAYTVAVLITLEVVGVDLTTLAVFSGALGVGIGLGLQRFAANFLSGIAILLERSVKIGDYVEIGGNTGWVRQLHMRYTLLETADGREVVVPNEELTSSRFTNWTFTNPRVRVEIKINAAYEADPQQVKRIMLDAARAHSLCLKDPEPACHVTEFTDMGVTYALAFWIPDVRDGRRAPQSEVMIAVLEAFRKQGVLMSFADRKVRGIGAAIP